MVNKIGSITRDSSVNSQFYLLHYRKCSEREDLESDVSDVEEEEYGTFQSGNCALSEFPAESPEESGGESHHQKIDLSYASKRKGDNGTGQS